MHNTIALTTILAALYHESGRASVQRGETLAHAAGQAHPFTEFPDLSHEARRGRELTAQHLLDRFEFGTRVITTEDVRLGLLEPGAPNASDIEMLAVAIHDSERDAIERGWVVVKLDPPRPFTPFADLPPQAQQGRRNQARWFLERFRVTAITTR